MDLRWSLNFQSFTDFLTINPTTFWHSYQCRGCLIQWLFSHTSLSGRCFSLPSFPHSTISILYSYSPLYSYQPSIDAHPCPNDDPTTDTPPPPFPYPYHHPYPYGLWRFSSIGIPYGSHPQFPLSFGAPTSYGARLPIAMSPWRCHQIGLVMLL